MTLLVFSLVVLWSAPFLYKGLSRYARVHALVERVLLLGLGALVVLDILPASYAVAGPMALFIALWGVLVPAAAERFVHQTDDRVRWIPLVIGGLGLAFHAAIDGAAFVDIGLAQARNQWLPYAVIVHRFFEGLFIWFALSPRFGAKTAYAVLAFSSTFTVLGFAFGGHLFLTMHMEQVYAYFQALVAGSLLHLAIDRAAHPKVTCSTSVSKSLDLRPGPALK